MSDPLRADNVSFELRLPSPHLAPGDLETIIHMSGGAVGRGDQVDTSFIVPQLAVPWTPTQPGSHLVKILVDPYGEPDDEDLHNNWREIRVPVR